MQPVPKRLGGNAGFVVPAEYRIGKYEKFIILHTNFEGKLSLVQPIGEVGEIILGLCWGRTGIEFNLAVFLSLSVFHTRVPLSICQLQCSGVEWMVACSCFRRRCLLG